MSDEDPIRRGDALAAVQLGETVTKLQARIAAIPAVDAEPVCTCCGGTGITYQTERRCACQPSPDVAALVRAAKAYRDARAQVDDTAEFRAFADALEKMDGGEK